VVPWLRNQRKGEPWNNKSGKTKLSSSHGSLRLSYQHHRHHLRLNDWPASSRSTCPNHLNLPFLIIKLTESKFSRLHFVPHLQLLLMFISVLSNFIWCFTFICHVSLTATAVSHTHVYASFSAWMKIWSWCELSHLVLASIHRIRPMPLLWGRVKWQPAIYPRFTCKDDCSVGESMQCYWCELELERVPTKLNYAIHSTTLADLSITA